MDSRFVLLRQPHLADEAVDVETVPLVGRDSAGRGMRLHEVPGFLEVGHDVANRRGRKLLARPTRQRARADRLPRRNVELDRGRQELAAAVVEDELSGFPHYADSQWVQTLIRCQQK